MLSYGIEQKGILVYVDAWSDLNHIDFLVKIQRCIKFLSVAI